ncbi:CTP-dependent riboflavin kinase [Halocatena salina]|uniref:Riboflavin kinase n=1 Tax=Halocatena salina TaxID=2934340 RepID=A0A8U0A035_9EURY|nr:CTP-dependent riboflavin kinase [Halocatena salina]UPM42109.1 CTP-dependent riboflavin kinase [Halocatena salina]
MAESTGVAAGADEREVLKLLALDGALAGRARVTCSELGDRLGVSTQTVSRRLQRLEDATLIERRIVSDGQVVETTEAGERVLRGEYADYRRLFEHGQEIELTGTVTGGMGEGSHYISLPGYMRQFESKLGYTPFAGTLNVELNEESVHTRAGVESIEPIRIEGWENDDRTYGPAFCWSASVEADGQMYESAHVIAPERTHHADDQLEVIAPDKLRDVLSIDDGDTLTTYVEK